MPLSLTLNIYLILFVYELWTDDATFTGLRNTTQTIPGFSVKCPTKPLTTRYYRVLFGVSLVAQWLT